MIWIRHCLVALLAMLMAGIVLTVLAIGVVTILLQRGPLELPQLHAMVEDRLNAQLSNHDMQIGSIALASSDTGVGNYVLLSDVSVLDETGASLITVSEVRTRLSLLDLVSGQISPEDVAIVGTELSLERDETGAISLFGSQGTMAKGENVLQLLDALEDQRELSLLKNVELENTRVRFEDQITKRGWVLDNSKLTIEREGDTVSGRAVLELGQEDGKDLSPASMILSANYLLGSEAASVSFQFSDASPEEIADLFQAFDWLRNFDTRLSGSVRAEFAGDGKLGNLHGVLELAEGKVAQTPASQPITFSTAKVYFDYDPETDALNLEQVDLKTSSGSVIAGGFVELQRGPDGVVKSMAGQLRARDIVIERPDLFDDTLTLNEAALDARLSFSPLKVEVGRLTVFDGDSVVKIAGSSKAGQDFWTNSYDIDLNKITAARLKQLWPKPVVHKTRKWVVKNIFEGTFKDISGGFRSKDGKPNYAFNFNVNDANFNFLNTMPHLQDGAGFGYLTEIDLRIDLSAGHVIAANGGQVDIAGSSIFIPDTDIRPTPGEITLHAKGGIEAALELLNVEKFRFLDKVGLTPKLGQGAVSLSGWFKLPLSKDTRTQDVKLAVQAELLNVKSTTLIKDRTLTSRKLLANVTHDGVEIAGDVLFDAVPVSAKWAQSFNQGAKQSTVAAKLDLNAKNLTALGIILPKGTVSGAAPAQMDITLNRGSDPKFTLTSDLVGATMQIPALGWLKPARTRGLFRVDGTLGDRIDIGDLVLDANGLNARGTVDLNADNTLQRARFSTVDVGKWLSTSAVLTPQAGGRTRITVSGGTADLRFMGDNGGSGETGSGATTIDLQLDRVRVTNDLSLTNFKGKLNTKAGLRGTFVGRVNGRSWVNGQLFPQRHGTAIELASSDAGGVMSSAGLLTNARDGALRVVLIPKAGDGNYDGTLDVKRTRIKDASAMAALLNGISLIGALQQLEGEGIHFNTIEGQFKIRGNGVKLENISAVGPSIGMTLDGWYDTKNKSVNFEGVVTPLYVVNGVFERLFGQLVGRRKGEGMFSFTYRMRGPASQPKVGVNPLSILTPGAFREIFRQKAPTPPS
ncbi:AsmA-like C-terminal region-containing protein [Amylibacter sp. IMCC11727]|uniref:YhdP family protein n=1 Tax=Amylibacter sp. IMCC11727 TaxID=3039851 RepID=UPI00244E0B49|nr:AsmA-like C-terminal region-containing protein [Amylibacter sp. IMCC11727]WGI20513.1 AsmA-like C-terminal region-containing protein [Amylibacter sp. IMCC11727]